MAKIAAKIIASFNNVHFYGQIYVWIYHPSYKSEGLYPIRKNVLCYPAIKITSSFEFDIQIGDFVVLEYNPNEPEAYYITKKIVIQ
jgi:hypothetical protein